jgi:hypothetical protein
VKDRFNLSDPPDRFRFFFELYSLLRGIRKDYLKPGLESNLINLVNALREMKLGGFTTTKRKHGGGPGGEEAGGPSKRRARADDRGNPSGARQNALDDPAVLEEFEDAGFVLEEDVPGWTRLEEVGPSSLREIPVSDQGSPRSYHLTSRKPPIAKARLSPSSRYAILPMNNRYSVTFLRSIRALFTLSPFSQLSLFARLGILFSRGLSHSMVYSVMPLPRL